MPFPSAGCQECKIRRIKCDETQPICQRCKKSHRICYGMRTGQDLSVVHIENSYASGEKKRPRGPRSAPTEEVTGKLNAVLTHPPTDLKTHAIAYYLHYHLKPLKDAPSVSRGVSEDFMPLWTSRPECQMLDLGISSMALAVFSRTQQHPPAAIEASTKYHQLLRITQVTLLSLDKGSIDNCLLAVFFMSRYEQVVHQLSSLNLKALFVTQSQHCPAFSHHDGALAILKVWKYHLSDRQPATEVIKHTRRSMIRSALLRTRKLPEWILDGTSFGEHGLELEYDRILIRIVNVRQRLFTMLKEENSLTLVAEELNKEAQDIDKALQYWAAHFPTTWSCRRHTLPSSYPWPSRDFFSPIMFSYSSPSYITIWGQYYSTRMLINSTRLRILQHLPSLNGPSDGQSVECYSRIKSMANHLASSVPFCLGRFKLIDNPDSSSHQSLTMLNVGDDIKPHSAHPIIWPLSIASSVKGVDIKQKSWFGSELARLGRMMGDKVLETADTDQWFQL